MSRIVFAAAALGVTALACSSSSYQLHPLVEGDDPTAHYIEQYETVLSYQPASVVSLSGRMEGEELVLTVAVRNASEEAWTVVPEAILVAVGDPVGTTVTLPAYSPARYLDRHAAARGTRLALDAESIDWDTRQNVRVATETNWVDEVSFETAGQLMGRTEATEPWTSVARRTAEIRGQVEAYDGLVASLSRGLLWSRTLEPGEYTFGKVVCPASESAGEYHVVVPVGRDFHEFVLVTDPVDAPPAAPVAPVPAALTSN